MYFGVTFGYCSNSYALLYYIGSHLYFFMVLYLQICKKIPVKTNSCSIDKVPHMMHVTVINITNIMNFFSCVIIVIAETTPINDLFKHILPLNTNTSIFQYQTLIKPAVLEVLASL